MQFLHNLSFLCLCAPIVALSIVWKPDYVGELKQLAKDADGIVNKLPTLYDDPEQVSWEINGFAWKVYETIHQVPKSGGECGAIARGLHDYLDHFTDLSVAVSQDRIRCSSRMTDYRARLNKEELQRNIDMWKWYADIWNKSCKDEANLVPFFYQEFGKILKSLNTALKKFEDRKTDCPKTIFGNKYFTSNHPIIAQSVIELGHNYVEDLRHLGEIADKTAKKLPTLDKPEDVAEEVEDIALDIFQAYSKMPNPGRYKNDNPLTGGDCASVAPAFGNVVDHIMSLSIATSQDNIRCSSKLTDYKSRIIVEGLQHNKNRWNEYAQRYYDNCKGNEALIPYLYQEEGIIVRSIDAAIQKFQDRKAECPKKTSGNEDRKPDCPNTARSNVA